MTSFIRDKLNEKLGAWISRGDMYKEYVRREKLKPKLTKEMIGRELARHATYMINVAQDNLSDPNF